jgi:hypothetical protein
MDRRQAELDLELLWRQEQHAAKKRRVVSTVKGLAKYLVSARKEHKECLQLARKADNAFKASYINLAGDWRKHYQETVESLARAIDSISAGY